MTISKSVFISRYVFSNSPLVSDAKFILHAKSLIKFEAVKVDTFPDADWYFFYSRNGVYFGLRQLEDRSFFKNIKIGTMGKGTAQQYESMQDSVPEFIGSGDADHVASEFLKVAADQKVIFVRAAKSMRSIEENLKGKVKSTDLVTYNNYIDNDIKIPKTDIAVFTSPMNVDGYFANKTFEHPNTLIALGKSTQNAINKYSNKEVLLPNEPSEYALKQLIDSIL